MDCAFELDVYFVDSDDDIMEMTNIVLEPYGSFPARRLKTKFKGSVMNACELDLGSYSTNSSHET